MGLFGICSAQGMWICVLLFHVCALVWSCLSPVDALVVCWGRAACGLLKSAHERVTAP